MLIVLLVVAAFVMGVWLGCRWVKDSAHADGFEHGWWACDDARKKSHRREEGR